MKKCKLHNYKCDICNKAFVRNLFIDINKKNIMELFYRYYVNVIKFVESIYFNKNYLENHLFYSSNVNGKIINIYDTN